ncbi:MAG: NAD(+) synthase [Actinobacteria bacterium]|nr:NAD(+) synthase [Actinomycetota bacterium]
MASSAADLLDLDPGRATEEIVDGLRDSVLRELRRRGAVVGISGGIDSSVVAALCARAFGPERVLGLLMPEADSSPDSLQLGRLLATSLGIETIVEDITATLTAFGCYARRDAAIRKAIPEYGPGWRSKIVLPPLLGSNRLRTYSVVVESPQGERIQKRLPASAYLEVVAATNFKQRTRKALEYFHADRLVYAVAGTPNRLEYDQGFFVKLGDGAADVKPIAHLYKTQVFRLAEHLGVPEQIRSRPPTTDTYSLPQGQDEFYFSVPYSTLDVCVAARDRGLSASAIAAEVGLSEQDVERVYADIDAKRRVAYYLHRPPLLVASLDP